MMYLVIAPSGRELYRSRVQAWAIDFSLEYPGSIVVPHFVDVD